MARFEVVAVWDLSSREELLVSGRPDGEWPEMGSTLRDESTQLTWKVIGRQFPCRVEQERGEITILLGRTGAEPPVPGAHLVA
jgi:hypothetical protein